MYYGVKEVQATPKGRLVTETFKVPSVSVVDSYESFKIIQFIKILNCIRIISSL